MVSGALGNIARRRGPGCVNFFCFSGRKSLQWRKCVRMGRNVSVKENEEDHPLSTPQPSQVPQSIRLSKMLLYVRLLTALVILLLNARLLISPPEEELARIDQLTSGQIFLSFLLMLLPIVVAIATLFTINKKKRMPAIVMSLVLLFISSVFSPLSQIDMLLVAVIVVMLFSRSARSYFSGIAMPAPVGRAVRPGRVETQAAGSEDGGDSEEDSQSTADSQGEPAPRRARLNYDRDVEIRPATVQDATVIYTLMQEAFEEYRAAVPPSSALDETIDSVREALQGGQGAAILLEDARPTAMVRYEIEGETIRFFRLSVVPSRRRRGYAKQLVKWVEHLGVSRGLNFCRCKVRQTVQNNVTMYENMGYEIVDQELEVRPGGTVKTLVLEKKLGV